MWITHSLDGNYIRIKTFKNFKKGYSFRKKMLSIFYHALILCLKFTFCNVLVEQVNKDCQLLKTGCSKYIPSLVRVC